jgi:hypothetical protein
MRGTLCKNPRNLLAPCQTRTEEAPEKQSKPNLTTTAMPTFGIPSPMPHVPRCRTLKLVAQRRRKLEEKSPFPEQPTPTPTPTPTSAATPLRPTAVKGHTFDHRAF